MTEIAKCGERPERGLPEQVKKFRLACSIPGPEDGTSLMRGLGPLSAMTKEDPRLELVLPLPGPEGWELGWSWLAQCDGLFLQRPYSPKEARACVMAKMMGLPVWVDWDDDLMTLPEYNPRKQIYAPERVGPVLERLTRLADYITVSTAEIGRRRKAEGRMQNAEGETAREDSRPTQEKITVVPNACMWPMAGGARERRITWRGWGNHDGDLYDAVPMLRDEARRPQNSMWKWCFIGERPFYLDEAIPHENLEQDPGADPFLYMQIFQRAAPFIHIVPLRDNAFNRCRSNLAWLEGTAAGAVVIAPDWEEWRRPGVINYTDYEGMRRALRNAMEQYNLGLGNIEHRTSNIEHRSAERQEHSNVAMSRAWIEQHLLLKQVNSLRWAIINGMISQKQTKVTKA